MACCLTRSSLLCKSIAMAPHSTADTWAQGHDYSDSAPDYRESHRPRAIPPLSQDRDIVEPIAVVGFSLRFPEDAISADSFWEMLMEGRCTATEFPEDRLSVDAVYHPDENRRGTVRTMHPRIGVRCLTDYLCSCYSSPFAADTLSKIVLQRLTHRSFRFQSPRQLHSIHSSEGF